MQAEVVYDSIIKNISSDVVVVSASNPPFDFVKKGEAIPEVIHSAMNDRIGYLYGRTDLGSMFWSSLKSVFIRPYKLQNYLYAIFIFCDL